MWASLALFITLAKLSDALKCYECTESASSIRRGKNAFDIPCGSFDQSVLTTCPNTSEVCFTMEGRKGYRKTTVHACGTDSTECEAFDGTVTKDGITMSCQTCDTDGCNTSADEAEVFADPDPEADSEDRLQCYQCAEGPATFLRKLKKVDFHPCDEFSEERLYTCPASSEVCNKQVIKFSDKTKIVIHGCGRTARDCDNNDDIKVKGSKMNCYSCDTTACNSAADFKISAIFLTIAVSHYIVNFISN